MPSPCSAAPITDEAELEDAASIVDFDAWHGVGSLQPLRLESGTQTLRYRTTASEDLALELLLALPADIAGGPVSVSLGRSSLMLAPPMPRSRDEIWTSRSGNATVRPQEDGRLSIELSGVVIENAFDGTLLRTLPRGSIVGSWIEVP
jgi:hypothetical protein